MIFSKMLSKRDKQNIARIEELEPVHRRVFKNRLIKKVSKSIDDLNFLILNLDYLNIPIYKVIDPKKMDLLAKNFADQRLKEICSNKFC